MGVGCGLYMYDVVVKRSRSLSHLLMSSCIHMYADDTKVSREVGSIQDSTQI